MKSLNKCAALPAFTLGFLMILFVYVNMGRGAGVNVQSLMEYFVMAADCLALVGSNTSSGWYTLIEGLEKLKPIDRRSRCYGYCFLRKAGIIEDSMAFKWSDRELTQFVSVLIKDYRQRGNFIIRAYFRCKHITPVVLGTSRCDNTLMFLVCMRCLGVSFLLVDAPANKEQFKYVNRINLEEEMERRLLEVEQLELEFDRTTLRINPDVTVLQGFRAEAFWNAFDGSQKLIGMMKGDCQPQVNNKSSAKVRSGVYPGPTVFIPNPEDQPYNNEEIDTTMSYDDMEPSSLVTSGVERDSIEPFVTDAPFVSTNDNEIKVEFEEEKLPTDPPNSSAGPVEVRVKQPSTNKRGVKNARQKSGRQL